MVKYHIVVKYHVTETVSEYEIPGAYMRKHSQPQPREAFRKQGVMILVLIIAILCCVVAIGVIVVMDQIAHMRASETYSTMDTAQVGTSGATTSTEETSSITESSAAETTLPAVSEITPQATTTQSLPTIPSGITGPDLTGYVVVLDPGHQEKPNREPEQLSPTMSGSKDKVTAGTQGVATGRPEYEVNLEIGLLLRAYLEKLGCVVYMTRTENDVNISNIERAQFDLNYSPDAYIRLHCDGSSDPNRKGIGVFVADTGKHKSKLVEWSDMLGEALSEATGAKYRGCFPSGRYSGLNWATDIPSFLLEMGYMTNKEVVLLLSDPDYQLKICAGIADFVSQMPLNPDRPKDLD